MADDTYLVLGPDGKVVPADLGPMMRRHRAEVIRYRADSVDQAASMFGDDAFGVEETYQAAEAAMPDGMVNAAAHIALTLAEVERYGWLAED
jgi:hypothetical protein